MRYTLTTLLLFGTLIAIAQHDVNWVIGKNLVLSFGNEKCEPEVIILPPGESTSDFFEGNSSISNSEGELLLCTSGRVAFDGAVNTIPNASDLGMMSTMGQNLILPKPNTDSIFYILSTEVQAGPGQTIPGPPVGLVYSEIKINQSGVASVISKHNLLQGEGNCEMLNAVPKSSGDGFWIIGHYYQSSSFYVFELTTSGINPTPNIYNVGPQIISPPQFDASPGTAADRPDAIGELCVSPQYNRIAFTTYYSGISAIFDFDQSTGVISNAVQLDLMGDGGYGTSFSPDGSKLYMSVVDSSLALYGGSFNSPPPTFHSGRIIQFDLSSYNQNDIQSSKTEIFECPDCRYASLKLGPDGKLYVAKFGDSLNYETGGFYIDVIENPNEYGSNCDFTYKAIYLDGLTGSWGLNNTWERQNYCESNLSAPEVNFTHSKKLIKVVDLTGRETEFKPNTLLIYIYSDGTTKKVFNAH
tara:strand:- start:24050 stop:25459 length:1410 start_codon:yes stop_codon:yes gene_type:complete